MNRFQEIIQQCPKDWSKSLPTAEDEKTKKNNPEVERNHNAVIDTANDVTVRGFDMWRLRDAAFLGTDIIDVYMNILQKRNDKRVTSNPNLQRSRFLGGFFADMLAQNNTYDYTRVRGWTKRFNVFSYNVLFFPVNLYSVHWTLLVINLRDKEMRFYDSMPSLYPNVPIKWFTYFKEWLKDEFRDKVSSSSSSSSSSSTSNNDDEFGVEKFKLFDSSSGNTTPYNHMIDVPEQLGSDCGVCTIVNADFLGDDIHTPLDIVYDPREDVNKNWRTKIGTDVLRGHLLY